MGLQKSYPQIDILKNKILDIVLIFGTAAGFVVYVLSLTRIHITGFEIAFVTDFITLSILILITVFRKRLSIKLKALITILGLYIFFLIDVIRLGVFSADKVLIVLIPFSALLVFSLRKSIIIFSFAVFTFFILAYLHLTKVLNAPPQDNITVSAWIINILLIIVVAVVIVIIQNKFNVIYSSLISSLEQKNIELSQKEKNYREIFNASTDAIFIHDLEGKILDVNRSMLKMYGYTKDEIAQISVSDLSSGNKNFNCEKSNYFLKEAMAGNPQVFDWQARKKNGDIFWVEVALKKSTIGGNERILAVVRDIDEKKNDAIQLDLYKNHLKRLVDEKTAEIGKKNKELQSANYVLAQQKEELVSTLNELQTTQKYLVQSEKMASLGTLTAGLAHEINNPLNFINGGVMFLHEYLKDNLPEHFQKLQDIILGINTGVKRTADIVKSLSQYSKNRNLPFESCDIHQILDDCLIILNFKTDNKININKIYTEIPFYVMGNESKLHQAFFNIILNSLQAVSDKGVIIVETILNTDKVEISIIDNGEGISAENLNKVFDPFFTTRDPGKGTGMGLAITYGIIKEHGGKIEVQSEINKGTIVKIEIPAIRF